MQIIDYQLLNDLLKRNAVTLIDVLPTESFEKTHIDGAINIPQEDANFAEEVENIAGGKNMPVAVYCASRACDVSKKSSTKTCFSRLQLCNVL